MDNQIKLTQTVKKGGCAAKVAASALRSILRGVRFPEADPDVLVDGRDFDDAAIYRIDDKLGIVQTLDFFTPIVDTPELFGKIAAANALSDVYAMGGIPKTCMAILAFPVANMEEQVITAVLNGACEKIAEAKASLVGGHSIDDESLKFGLSCTGVVPLDRVWANTGAKVGDKLILTKALGSGTLCAGLKSGSYTEAEIEEGLLSMCKLNNVVELLGGELCKSVHAATDVTGFGLAGHGMQLAKASGVELEILVSNVPRFKLTEESLESGHLTKAHRSNKEYTSSSIELSGLSDVEALMVFDPQTSGGLLLSVEGAMADRMLGVIREEFPSAKVIGEVKGGSEGRVRFYR